MDNETRELIEAQVLRYVSLAAAFKTTEAQVLLIAEAASRSILTTLKDQGWRSPEEVAALIKPWEDEARASRGVRAGCTI